ncbi:ABC transporter permease [Lactobacillus sp. ESL0731]|uniref:ABC transporter permease n=1 Tax=unclassified Lactobacillus TaxID=2620435 RepID=UPI0023F76C81|nr:MULTISPECIES: ABC transporter permease [unclassified Lactobacillus]WEV51179.1 ABC transporter permease [Lactobacillus sp. ESL0700]WEV62309.1 ABC transporter permease [Lactobacillus sp. ESL0731]
MSIKQIWNVMKLNLRLQLSDPTIKLIMICVPLIMVPFMRPAAKMQLIVQGYMHANGAEQVVPGLAIMFSFLSVQVIVQMFYHESDWNTWDRQQVSATTVNEIIFGKVAVAYLIQVFQLAIVILLSQWLFNFKINGSWPAFIAIIMSFAATLTFFGVLIVSLTNSEEVALSLSNLLGMLMSGLGGSLSPTSTFPHWAKQLAKFDPAYWAMTGIKKISLDAGTMANIHKNLLILWIITGIFCIVAIIGFHFKPLKEGNN